MLTRDEILFVFCIVYHHEVKAMETEGYFVEYYTRCRRESIYRLCNEPFTKPSIKRIPRAKLRSALSRYFELNSDGMYMITEKGRTIFRAHIIQVDQEQIQARGKNRSLLLEMEQIS